MNVNDVICVGASFYLGATAVGTAPLDRIVTGRNLEPGKAIICIESSGIHSSGLTLARKAFFNREQPLPYDFPLPKAGVSLGQELLRPTLIYVREVMEIIARVPDVKALINITSDGLSRIRISAGIVGCSCCACIASCDRAATRCPERVEVSPDLLPELSAHPRHKEEGARQRAQVPIELVVPSDDAAYL